MACTSTNETTPFHIWKHNVICAARVAVADLGDDLNAKLKLWYCTGEPVEMAATSLAFVVRERAKIERADRESRIAGNDVTLAHSSDWSGGATVGWPSAVGSDPMFTMIPGWLARFIWSARALTDRPDLLTPQQWVDLLRPLSRRARNTIVAELVIQGQQEDEC